jgi:sulfoxide reductase heme-binding subunit YedZ
VTSPAPTETDARPGARQGAGAAHAEPARGRPAFDFWALLKPALFVLALLPLARLAVGLATGGLGANPAETVIRSTGEWALVLLVVTLAITPLRRLPGLARLARLRRMAGLYTFFYALLHAASYALLDFGLDWPEIVRDIGKRPFILVGFTAFVLLLPLAATSFDAAVRALGAGRWQALHRLVYLIAPLAVLHFYWMKGAKNLTTRPLVYGTLLALLLGWRLVHRLGRRRRQAQA